MKQLQLPYGGIEVNVNGAIRIEQQPTAIEQIKRSLFAHATSVVGTQVLPKRRVTPVPGYSSG